MKINIQEINITNFPVVLASDTHCSLGNLNKLQQLYPNNLLLHLGDESFLWDQKGEGNKKTIQYFIDNKIPNILGNHSDFILGVHDNNRRIVGNVTDKKLQKFNITEEQVSYLKSLPIGFKLILPNKKYYLLYHNIPSDLWIFNDKGSLTEQRFRELYLFDNDCLGVCQGHLHKNFIETFPNISTKRICIGHLCNDKTKTGENYALLTENGIEFKKL
jgi:predicted phosphodiesterase